MDIDMSQTICIIPYKSVYIYIYIYIYTYIYIYLYQVTRLAAVETDKEFDVGLAAAGNRGRVEGGWAGWQAGWAKWLG